MACEESQAVTIELRKLGHKAYSCDLIPCSGGHPEWHIQQDVLGILSPKNDGELKAICFSTCDDKIHVIDKWDLIIEHPPCTYLTCSGNRWFKPEYKNRFSNRERQREEAVKFFMEIWNAECDKVAIENPQGIMSSRFRRPDQYIEPFMFGDPEKKKTGLWLRGLEPLKPTNVVAPVIIQCRSGAKVPRWHYNTLSLPPKERSRRRSVTFPGIARAMAQQWTEHILKEVEQK